MTTFHTLGFPRVGPQRELKWALESYWRGEIDQATLISRAHAVRHNNWQTQLEAGCDVLTVGDFCLYDHVLNASFLLGHLPQRTNTTNNTIDQLFLAARGRAPSGTPTKACEMSKWFDTNYHYLVPECHANDTFNLNPELLLEEIRAGLEQTKQVKPVILGPLSYLYLARSVDGCDRLELLAPLLAVYEELLATIKAEGVEWVQIDEPILVLDLPEAWLNAFESTYQSLATAHLNILISTYFGGLENNLSRVFELPVQGVHLDIVSAPEQLAPSLALLKPTQVLSLGIINGRNIWRSDLTASYQLLAPLASQLKERLWIATSCSLLHVPYSAKSETNLADGADHWLAFAEEKLAEGRLLTNALDDAKVLLGRDWLAQAERVISRQQSKRVHKAAVKARAIEAASRQWQRELPYAQRLARQQAQLNLPDFPTTTIGSFPQTDAIRSLRKRFKKGDITLEDYECGLKLEIEYCIKAQENIGLDVLVHGEAERNDMVEYFGELLEGIAVSANGWVQSYGSRCVKPPIIYGDIERLQAMTVRWSQYAQSLSAKPVKGMLTGPITLLKWAFVRDDQSWESTAYQLAAVLQDEVLDLECAGISIIQIDEPALREALPLRRDQHQTYLNWAVNSFRYTYAGVAAETQIHTHMCYADFDDILTAIQAMDADVITLETARSANKLLQTLKREPYHNGIGPGVYDIHSPNVPDVSAMSEILEDSLNVVPAYNLWVNPDCGLKTRRWEEVTPALKSMVRAAQALREQITA